MEFRRNFGQVSSHSAVFFLGTIFTMGAGYLVKIYVARVLGAGFALDAHDVGSLPVAIAAAEAAAVIGPVGLGLLAPSRGSGAPCGPTHAANTSVRRQPRSTAPAASRFLRSFG